MQAIVARQYGSPDVLHLETLDRPVPGPNQVLLRVRAASVNPLDYHLLHGAPLIRLFSGLRRPRASPFAASTLPASWKPTGPGVTRFLRRRRRLRLLPGRLCRICLYVAESAVVAAPGAFPLNMPPRPGRRVTALQGLRDKGRLQAGQKVLIHGASGGVGTFAVQIAKDPRRACHRRYQPRQSGVCSRPRRRLCHRLHPAELYRGHGPLRRHPRLLCQPRARRHQARPHPAWGSTWASGGPSRRHPASSAAHCRHGRALALPEAEDTRFFVAKMNARTSRCSRAGWRPASLPRCSTVAIAGPGAGGAALP